MSAAPLFRYKGGALPNIAALAYCFAGYGAGLCLITNASWVLNAAGTLLLAHALIVSAYFIHEFVHGAIFSKPKLNDAMGEVMAWVTGACFASYRGLKEKHLRHHADRLDVVTFDYRAFLSRQPGFVRNIVLALEWAYIPAVEILMHSFVITAQYKMGDAARQRTTSIVLAVRIVFFVALAVISLKAVLLYAVSYLLFLQVLRFEDAFQHTFDLYATSDLAPAPAEMVRDRAYEHTNTYTNVLSDMHPLLNLLVLNFGYHNAHHARPAVPWHQLPKLHANLYGGDMRQVLPAPKLLVSFHKHRVTRVMQEDYGHVAQDGDRAGNFVGAVGVSFLTAV
jgi:fatty acid desaturase